MVRRMTNSIRPVVVASLLGKGEAQMTLRSREDAIERSRGKLQDKTKPNLGGGDRWLGAERSEGWIHEARRPERRQARRFIAPDKGTKNRPFRSQSVHTSDEAG